MKYCDNINSVHLMKTLNEVPEGIEAVCEKCHYHTFVRTGDSKKYSKVFKRDTLQQWENLYYKEYPQKMNVAY